MARGLRRMTNHEYEIISCASILRIKSKLSSGNRVIRSAIAKLTGSCEDIFRGRRFPAIRACISVCPLNTQKGTKALPRRFCFIGVLRVFRGYHFFVNHPCYQRNPRFKSILRYAFTLPAQALHRRRSVSPFPCRSPGPIHALCNTWR